MSLAGFGVLWLVFSGSLTGLRFAPDWSPVGLWLVGLCLVYFWCLVVYVFSGSLGCLRLFPYGSLGCLRLFPYRFAFGLRFVSGSCLVVCGWRVFAASLLGLSLVVDCLWLALFLHWSVIGP